MSHAGRRVIKLGGSLLDLPNVVERLRAWLALQAPRSSVLVVGGGQAVDDLRAADRASPGIPCEMHWRCVRAMGVNARRIADQLGTPVVKCGEDLQSTSTEPALHVFDVQQFLEEDSRSARKPLPCDWSVTSDSIAACLANKLGAAELVLLKSKLPDQPVDFKQLSLSRYVDAYFAQAGLGKFTIRAVNLRKAAFDEVTIRASKGRGAVNP